MGSSKDYSNVAEWKTKDTGYHTGDMVRHQNNIFRAAYWAGKEPGVDPGWSLYDELYDQTSPTPTATAKIIGCLPTWRTDLDFGNAVMYRNITHGIIAFLNFDENNLGELDQSSAKAVTAIVQKVVTTAHQAGTYISVAIGGAVDYGFLNLLTAVGSNASDARLDKAVQNVTQFVKDNALDGVDLDLECWWDKNGDASKDQGGRDKSKGPHPAGSALLAFAQKLKAALPGKLVSATLFATSWYGNAYDPKLADHVDWLSIMSYDLTGSWNQTRVGPHTALNKIRKQDQYKDEQQGPWPITARGPSKDSTPMDDNPIFSVEDALWYWSNPFFVNWQGEGQKVARNKLVAGVPLYGYDFAYIKDKDPESGQTPPGYKVLRYKELVQQFPGASTAANANIKVSGNTPRPSFVSAPGTYPYAHNIYLETPDTAVAKLKFLNQLGLQGVIIWEMSNEVWDDGKSIVKALYQASGNPATRPALPVPGFAKPPVQSGDLTGKAGQTENTLNHGTNGTQGIVVFHDTLFAVYEGYQATPVWSVLTGQTATHAPTNEMWYTGFKDGKWESPTDTKTPYGTTGAPALIVYKGLKADATEKLYAFHEGRAQNSELWYATAEFDNGNLGWNDDGNTGFKTTGAPALAVFDSKIHCVHLGRRPTKGDKGETLPPDSTLYWTTFDGENFSENKSLGVQATGTPSLGVYDNKLYCAYQSIYNGEFWYLVYDKKNWTSGDKTGFYTWNAPSLAAYNNKLYAFHEGYQSSARSYKLWYTACETGETDFNAPKDTDTGFGVTDPPSLLVANNTLYCVHAGRAGNGQIWWFYIGADGNLSGDEQLNGSTASPPALVEFDGQLYCVYQKAGDDGYIGWTSLPFDSHADHPDLQWTEIRGDNSYGYDMLDVQAASGSAVSTSKTINVQAGTPAVYGALTNSEDDVGFPSGATLTITTPDGTTFSTERDDDTALVLLSGMTLQALVLVNPKAGNYQVALSVPSKIPFHFEFATVPSKDVFTTIVNAISTAGSAGGSSLTARDLPINPPGSLLRFRSRGALDQLARLWIMVAKRGVSNPQNRGRAAQRAAGNIGRTLPTVLTAAIAFTLENLRTSLQLAAEQQEQPQNIQLDGDFWIDLYNGNDPAHYTSYREFILALRIAFLERRTNGNDFAVRAPFGGEVAPWIRINHTNLYLSHFNNQTGGTRAPPLTANTWNAIPPNRINYPEAEADPRQQITINLGAVTGAMANANTWAAAGGRGIDLTTNTIVTLAFVISEAARFDLVAFATEAALDFRIANGNLTWDWFRIVLTDWNTTFNQGVPTSLEDTERFINGLPQTEANSRQYLQGIVTTLRGLGYLGWGANAPGR